MKIEVTEEEFDTILELIRDGLKKALVEVRRDKDACWLTTDVTNHALDYVKEKTEAFTTEQILFVWVAYQLTQLAKAQHFLDQAQQPQHRPQQNRGRRRR